MLIPSTLARRIRASRKKAGLSQKEFAHLAGCGQTTLLRIEGGKTTRIVESTLDGINRALKELREKPEQTRARAAKVPPNGAPAKRPRARSEHIDFKRTPDIVLFLLCSGKAGNVTWEELQFLSILARSNYTISEPELWIELLIHRIRLAIRNNAPASVIRGAVDSFYIALTKYLEQPCPSPSVSNVVNASSPTATDGSSCT